MKQLTASHPRDPGRMQSQPARVAFNVSFNVSARGITVSFFENLYTHEKILLSELLRRLQLQFSGTFKLSYDCTCCVPVLLTAAKLQGMIEGC